MVVKLLDTPEQVFHLKLKERMFKPSIHITSLMSITAIKVLSILELKILLRFYLKRRFRRLKNKNIFKLSFT